jgi:predicted enzyme related to lactoylglutathione lyase
MVQGGKEKACRRISVLAAGFNRIANYQGPQLRTASVRPALCRIQAGHPVALRPLIYLIATMRRLYDHIDLRAPKLTEVTSFYEHLLPALGFVRRVDVEGWLQFEAADGEITAFFGVTESPGHVANENRIAFWVETNHDVDRLAEVALRAGARAMEGPMPYEPGYYAVFFEDPCGNRLEICHRIRA